MGLGTERWRGGESIYTHGGLGLCFNEGVACGGGMESAGWLDWVAGGMAIAILVGGLVMLLSGVSAMNRR
jgi:hypothetical protein